MPPQSPFSTSLDQSLAAKRWDAEYLAARYVGEPALSFVERTLATLGAERSVSAGTGLYVGCGNGRNHLSFVRAGLHLYGLDFSREALRQLAARDARRHPHLICADFRTFSCARAFDYLIAIQVFQHGTERDVRTYFSSVRRLLRPGGLFFLRVNAVSTQISQPHAIAERNDAGGVTVQYLAGPKRGLPIHFYSREELDRLTRDAFEPVTQPLEVVTERVPPESGTWAQWEASWRRI